MSADPPIPANRPLAQRELFVACTLMRITQGIAFGVVLTAAAAIADSNWQTGLILLSATVCGMAVGSPLDRIIQTLFSQRAATITTLLPLVAGVIGMSAAEQPAVQIVFAFMIGLGLGTDWSAVSQIARSALMPKRRWKGMRLWAAAFPMGIAVVLLTSDQWPFSVVVTSIAVSVTIAFFIWPPIRSLRTEDSQSPDSLDMEQAVATNLHVTGPGNEQNPKASDTPDENADCEAEECCGGANREFAPTGFWHGVLLSGIGLSSFFWPLAIMSCSGDSIPVVSLPVFIGAAIVGYWLILSVAPTTGYAISLLPFFVMAVPATAAAAFFPTDSLWFNISCGLAGFAVGGVTIGLSSIVGELFADCADNPVRTRVISFSMFAACVLLLIAGLVGRTAVEPRHLLMVQTVITCIGIFAVRAIPSPVLSSKGQDDDSEQTQEELNDVLAAINQ